jgi:hypothetical protein
MTTDLKNLTTEELVAACRVNEARINAAHAELTKRGVQISATIGGACVQQLDLVYQIITRKVL